MKVQYVLHLFHCTPQDDIQLHANVSVVMSDLCLQYLIFQVAVDKAREQGIFEEFSMHLAVVP
jgi:hypothetical protein